MEIATHAISWITADRVAAAAVAIQAVAIVVGLPFAARQLKEAERLRLEQARPHVIVDVSTRQGTGSLLYISLENIGRTVARDISVKFEPPLVSTLDGGAVRNGKPHIRDLQLWKHTPTLPPGRKLECLFDKGPDRFKMRGEMPDRTTATVSYQGEGGPLTGYSEQFVIDLEVLWDLTMTGELYLTDLVQSARNIEKHIEKINQGPDLGQVRVVLETDEQRRSTYRGFGAASGSTTGGSAGRVSAAVARLTAVFR